MPVPTLLLLLAGAAAQTSAAAPSPHRWGATFISPMGEPFHARDAGGDALAEWFAQADRNHDGQLTVDEMESDAERFFAVLDTNHDGEIDPDEIERYESVIAPEVSSGPHLESAGLEQSEAAKGGRRGHRSGQRDNGRSQGGWRGARLEEGYQGAERFGLLDLPEPVISADTNFDRGVSLEEFRQAAIQRFGALDVNHQGRLTLAVLENLRPAPPPVPHKSDDGSAPTDPDINPGGSL